MSHCTTLIPKGLFRIVEDSEREVEENTPDEGEIVMPSTKEMVSTDMWVHESLNILNVCRTAHLDPEVPDDAPEDLDPEELKKQLEAKDPYEPKIKTNHIRSEN